MSNVSKEIAIELVEDGQAGNGIVSVTRTYGISASGTTASDTTSPSDITTWSAGSPTVTTAKPYLWVKEVTVYTETPDTTKYYCVGKRGDNGIDAKDFEWAYIRTTTPTAPTILNDSTYTDSNSKTYTSDGHLPHVTGNENIENNQSTYECTDDPKGVTDTWKYEWEIKRTKGAADATTGARTWNYYSGTMTMHNNYAESAFIIDIDNDNDQFGTDSESKVLVEQTRSTNVTVYDGATPQTLTSLTATLKYEDGTSVPTSVATKTTDATTGAVSVTVKQSNTANTHTEIQAHISAVCAKGTKTIVFTLYKVMSGAPGLTPIIYNVAATDKVFSFQRTDANALTPNSRTSQINVARTEGNTTTTISSATTGLTYSWGFEDEANATNAHSGVAIGTSISISNTDASSHSSVWVLLSTGDRETLAIVKDGAKGNSGTSVEAQYAPNSSPTSSQIHTTFQNGDKYMRTRSGSGSWSGWQKIVGENGAETDFTFNISKNKTSTNASTAPANCYYGEWQDAPIAVTTTYPYLWAKVVQKDGDGTVQSTRYIRLTGEDGKSVIAQYSVDGSSNWHTTFATGDEWMRTSDNGGTSWSAAMKIVGEKGDSTNFEFGISQYQTANGAPSDISTWSDAPIATTSSKPYLWSKVTTPDGTVSYIRLTGEKGASITKSSEVSTYKVSDSGTTTPTGTWYSTKAAANNAYAWSANRYMWTKTVITWSDTSTTTLYSAERNPDDGDPGMSIVIASQSVTYSKQTSGNLDPTTLTYGSYPSSLSKGDWLYSKTTVNYETSEGASAGSTSTYSVSYIGTDGVGQAGRGITGVYEHYKASANSTGETTPTSTDWGTTPTPTDWGKDKPYLWNYERITYSSGTTVERTTAGVVAVWTEDGAGIDSITNYYLATSASSGVTTSTSGWTTSVQTMDETNCYLWNYERISYTQGKSSTTTTPHIIGHYGKNGTSPYVADIDNEMDAVSVDQFGYIPQLSLTEGSITYAAKVQTTAKLFKGSTPQSFTLKVYDEGGTEYTNNGSYRNGIKVVYTSGSQTSNLITVYFQSGALVGDKKVFTITLDSTYSVQFTVKGVQGDIYQLLPNIDEVVFGVDGTTNEWTPLSIGVYCGYTKNVGGTKTEYVGTDRANTCKSNASYTEDGTTKYGTAPYNIFFRFQNADSTWGSWSWNKDKTNGTIPIAKNTTYVAIQFILTSATGTGSITEDKVLDRETIQIIKSGKRGDDGTSPYIADLDNEMDSVACDKNGKVKASTTCGTNVSLFYGSSKRSYKITGITKNGSSTMGTGVTVKIDDNTPSYPTSASQTHTVSVTYTKDATISSKDDFAITLQDATDTSITRVLRFTINGVREGANGEPAIIFRLNPNVSEIVKKKNGTYIPAGTSKVTCAVLKTTGSKTSEEPIDETDDYVAKYKLNGTGSEVAFPTNGITVNTITSKLEIMLYDANGDVLLDKETIPLVEDGTDGDNSIRLALDNEHEDFIYSESGKVAPSSITSQARLYDGVTDKTSDVTEWRISDNNGSSWGTSTSTNATASIDTSTNKGLLTVTGITASSVKIKVRAKYNNVYYYADFTINKTKQDKYDIVVKPNAIAYNPANYSTQTIALSIKGTSIQGTDITPAPSIATDGTYAAGQFHVFYGYVKSNGKIYKPSAQTTEGTQDLWSSSLSVTSSICASWEGIYFELRQYTSSSAYRVCDYETVEIAKSENGNNGDGGLSIAITPSTIVVNTDSNGVTEAASQDFTFKVYKGKDEVPTSEYNVTHSSLPDSDWTWTGLYSNAFRIQCANGAMFTTPTVITVTVALSSDGSIQTSVLLVPNRKGAEGASAIHLDLDNEMDSILYSGGSKVGDSVTSQATLYNGGAPFNSGVTFTKDSSSTATGTVNSAGLVTVTGLPSNSSRGVIVVKATYNQVDYFATFTVDKIVDKPKYEISVDKSAIVINTDTTSASQSIVVRIWKSEVNSSGGITRTNITSLGNDLKLFYQVGGNQAGTISYSSGSGTVTSITASSGQVTVWLTDSTGSSSSKVTGLLDIETVPVASVKNGQQGIQGKMGRTPYYWGKWSDKESTDAFTVNDYMTPYVANGETGGIPQCWIFVGANGTYTKSTADEPSNSSTNWQLMTSDFEYLITKAIFSDFAQLGSGIFNGDYMYSQYGTYDGTANDNHYERFTPQVFQDTIVLKSETTTTTINQSETTIGTSYLVKGAYYKIIIGLSNVTSSTRIYLNGYVNGSSTASPAWNEAVSSSSTSFVRKTVTSDGGGYWKDSGNVTWKVRVAAGTANVTYAIIEHIDFNPNLSIDWLNGIIRANTGWFKNVVIEGVMNNLIQEITSENYTDYGVYTSGTNADAFWLNTAKVGSIIRYKYTKPLGLPSAYANAGTPVETYLCDSGDGTHQMTLNELRQCIGKKIYVLTDENTGMARIRVGKWFSALDQEKMLLYNNTWYYDFSSNTTLADWFWVFECKMGERNGRECIYWELLASHNKLPDNLAF